VAVAFGVSLLTVQRRLKLAAVSPKLLALYREDDKKINLDHLMALAISDDHAAQERAWFDAHEWDRAPATLKRKLTAGEVEAAGSALVRFVGIEAYEAAGGIVRRDLFDDEQGRFLSDPDLLTRLAGEKLEGIAAAICEGWGWVEARIELDSPGLRQFTPCEHTVRKPNAEERGELAALSAREAELERESQALSGERAWHGADAERINLEGEDIEARRRAICEGLKVWPAEIKARAGVIVTVNREGDPAIIRGLLREAVSVWPWHLDPLLTAGQYGGHENPGQADLRVGAGRQPALAAARGSGGCSWPTWRRPHGSVSRPARLAVLSSAASSGAGAAPRCGC
jgi:ParB family transcriptional regulator, chromosome partitioning protein